MFINLTEFGDQLPLHWPNEAFVIINRTGGTMKKFKNALKNQKGQGVMEYVILASLIGIFCLGAVKQFGEVINKRITYMRSEIVDNIKAR